MSHQRKASRAFLSGLAIISTVVQAAPVAPTEEHIDASRAAGAVTLSGGNSSPNKTVVREDSKTIDLLIDLQDKTAPKGDQGRTGHSLTDRGKARSANASGTADAAAAASYFGVPAAAQSAKAQDSERAEQVPAARQPATSGGPQGGQPPYAQSGLSSWLPRGLLSWVRDHRYEVLAAALGTVALFWIASVAVVQRRR